MKKIKRWFTHNPLLKLISLGLAIVLWLIVVNTSNPKVTDSVTLVYDVLNEKSIESENQIYFTNTSMVTISYSVRSKYRSQVSEDAFSAYINLEDYSVSGVVPVYIEIDSGVSDLIADVTVNPSSIHVTTENIQQKKFIIEKFIEGNPADGYVAGEMDVTPESIYVKGPVSVIGKISFVGVTVSVENATSDLTGVTTVSFYDANGNILSGIEDNLSFAGDVSYSIPVYRIKSLTVNAFTGGAPATGYTVDSVETSPTFISVYGPEEILNQYDYIVIPGSDLNITGMSENVTFNLETQNYIPEGLELAAPTPEITVYVKFRNVFERESEAESPEASGPGMTVPVSEENQTEALFSETAAESIQEAEESASPDLTEESGKEDETESTGEQSPETETMAAEETLPQ